MTNNDFNVKTLICVTKLEAIFENNFFDICSIDALVKMMGITIPSETYKKLRALHCIYYDKMPSELHNWLYETVTNLFTDSSISLSERFKQDCLSSKIKETPKLIHKLK